MKKSRKELAKPFLKLKKRAKAAVLLIHSWSASPHEFRELGDFLYKKGFTVYCPLLLGHGTHYKDLNKISTNKWTNQMKRCFLKLKKTNSKVFIIGSSFGAAIAFNLAKKHKISGIITIGCPYDYKKKKLFQKIMYTDLFRLDFRKYDYLINVEKAYCANDFEIYKRMPLKSIITSSGFIKKSVRDIKDVKCPVLIMQSTTDHLIIDSSAEKIYKGLGSKDKKICFMKNMYHVLTVDKNRKRLYPIIYDFIKKRI